LIFGWMTTSKRLRKSGKRGSVIVIGRSSRRCSTDTSSVTE
jgi:hypothetical protein